MFKKIICANLFVLNVFCLSVFGQEKTIVNDAAAKKMLLGKHLLSLQWISWDYFGTAHVTDKKGVLYLKGEQKQRNGSDYVNINGVITEINARNFVFDGVVEMQITHNNGGAPCKREGEMTFAVTKNRKYWRLQEMDNPCDDVTDYVDIYFRGK